MSEKQQIVTIDGPAGVGKSTVSRGLARRLGFTYLDTGAMYRAVAYACHKAGIAPDDEQAVAALIHDLTIELQPPASADGDVRVFLNGMEISDFVRTQEMGMLASRVSALPVVRRKLTDLQQRMGEKGKIVAEGRDTGTVVFPQAAWKFYLDARPEERARRRAEQLRDRGEMADEAAILAQIIKRDQDDRQRTIAPLKAAADAIVIDSTDGTADDVIRQIIAHIKQNSFQPV
jgi:cytidylate kinase